MSNVVIVSIFVFISALSGLAPSSAEGAKRTTALRCHSAVAGDNQRVSELLIAMAKAGSDFGAAISAGGSPAMQTRLDRASRRHMGGGAAMENLVNGLMEDAARGRAPTKLSVEMIVILGDALKRKVFRDLTGWLYDHGPSPTYAKFFVTEEDVNEDEAKKAFEALFAKIDAIEAGLQGQFPKLEAKELILRFASLRRDIVTDYTRTDTHKTRSSGFAKLIAAVEQDITQVPSDLLEKLHVALTRGWISRLMGGEVVQRTSVADMRSGIAYALRDVAVEYPDGLIPRDYYFVGQDDRRDRAFDNLAKRIERFLERGRR